MPLLQEGMVLAVILGALVKQLRGRMSQTELARKLGTDQTYVSKLESGEVQMPSRNVLFALADEFRISEVELLRAAGYIRPQRHEQEDTEFERAAISVIRRVAREMSDREKQYLLSQLRAIEAVGAGDSEKQVKD